MINKLRYILGCMLLVVFIGNTIAQDTIFDDFTNPQLTDSLWERANRTWSAGNPPIHGGVIPELVTISGGNVIIEGHGNLYSGNIMGHGRKTKVGGCLISKAKYASGSYEVKAKILPKSGALSAFWTFDFAFYPSSDSGNINHEIDIEVKMDSNAFNQALCNTWIYEKVYTLRTNNEFFNQDDGEYHIYRFDWHTGGNNIEPRVEYYFDGILKETVKTTVPTRASNFWFGVWFPSWAGSAEFEVDTMWVDYVKIISFHEPNDIIHEFQADSLTRQPFHGESLLIPGKIEAEDFDIGNSGDSYYDNDKGNTGNAYRWNSDVDIEAWPDSAFAIGYIEDNEWVEYTVDIIKTGDYNVVLSIASNNTEGGMLHIEIDSFNITGKVAIPNTNGWGNFETLTIDDVEFPKGEHTMRVFFDKGGFNLDYINIKNRTTGNIVSQNISKSEMDIYPTPCKDDFSFDLNVNTTEKEGVLTFYSLDGDTILTKRIYLLNNSCKNISIRGLLKPGIYILHLLVNKEVFQSYLIVQ